MYRKFAFEGDVHETLNGIPLGVRRKLDIAGVFVPLEGWLSLPFEERLVLCHLPVDTDEEIDAYRMILETFAARSEVPLDPLPRALPWRTDEIPAPVRERLATLEHVLDAGRWATLDDDARFALVKLADAHRSPWKFLTVLDELGLSRSSRRHAPGERGGAAILE